MKTNNKITYLWFYQLRLWCLIDILEHIWWIGSFLWRDRPKMTYVSQRDVSGLIHSQTNVSTRLMKFGTELSYSLLRHWPHWRFSIMNISSAASGASFYVESIFVCIYHWYFTMSNIFIINITLSSEFWIYSISREICARFCCALLCCGYAIVHNEFTWSIYPYSSGLLCWH